MKNKLLVKWNNSALAILCSKCSVIIKTGKDFTKEEMDFVLKGGGQAKYWLPPSFCPKCIGEKNDKQSLSVK